MDGHSGIENRQVNQAKSGQFQLILAYLKHSSGLGSLVIHATSNVFYSYGRQRPLEFLHSLGLQHFRGECQFHRDRCFWHEMATLRREIAGFENEREVERIHRAFTAFSSKVAELFTLRQRQDEILQEIGMQSGGLPIFNVPVELRIDAGEAPSWVHQIKFPRLMELEKQRVGLDSEITDLSSFLPLVYSTGEPLVAAVLKAVRFLGLSGVKTEPGFTADILAQSADGALRFGIEVTGTNGPIKKDSNKLTQLMEFERIKEHSEKTILVANTYNTKPIAERGQLENFTQPVVDFLSRHPILLMTGWDLYRMVADVLAGTKSKDEMIRLLYEKEGVLTYQ